MNDIQHKFKSLSQSIVKSRDLENELRVLISSIRNTPEIMDEIKKEKRRKVAVFVASDSGRAITIIFEEGDISGCLGYVEDYDLKFEATEAAHLGILSGQLDPDSAFFARRIKITGSLIDAVKLKNLFLKINGKRGNEEVIRR